MTAAVLQPTPTQPSGIASPVQIEPRARVQRYIDGVLGGSIPACKQVKQCIRRHLWDLEHAEERGLKFEATAGECAILFFGLLRHSKGEWAGDEFDLSDWQCFIIWVVFGWKRANGYRRFRIAYIEVPRKNGKSTFAAGVGLFLFDAEGEPGAEVYTAATKRDQARLVHSEAIRMVKSSPALRGRIQTFKDELHVEDSNSVFKPLGADADTTDGLNVHGAIVDELHAHKTRAVFDVLDTATGSRRQPLIFEITTAGCDPTTICGETHDHALKLLDGFDKDYLDDGFFCFIASIDDGDDWTQPSSWAKANPNFGISVKEDDLRDKCNRAQKIPSAQSEFLRKHLDVWTDAENPLFPMDRWDACAFPIDLAALEGRRCHGGLDLSKIGDLTAFVQLFEPRDEKERWIIRPWFWLPEAGLERQLPPVINWAKRGLIKITPGNATDYEYVRKVILEQNELCPIDKLAFDDWNAHDFAQRLVADGIRMEEFGQNIRSFNEPTKKLVELVIEAKVAHGGNPVLRWMAANTTAKTDANDNWRPVKPDRNSKKRIDGIVATIMPLGVMIAKTEQPLQWEVF